MASERKTIFLSRLDSVRGLGASAIAFAHTLGLILPNRTFGMNIFDRYSYEAVVKTLCGLVAVTMFFVITGVVFGRSLDSRPVTTWEDYLKFLVRRGLRLYPAHCVAIAVILGGACLIFTRVQRLDFSSFSEFSPSFVPEYAGLLNGDLYRPIRPLSVLSNFTMLNWSMNWVVWSLYVEICAAPFIPLFHLTTRRRSHWLDAVMLTGLVALAWLNWDHLWSRFIYVFYLGMMVETTGAKWADWLHARFGLLGATLLAWLAMVTPNIIAARQTMPIYLLEVFGGFTFIALIVRSEKFERFPLLQNRALRWSGKLSYSFYLYHFFLLTIAARVVYSSLSPQDLLTWANWICLLVLLLTFTGAFLVAQMSYKFVELPGIDLARQITRGKLTPALIRIIKR
jgi:peptidoglycan/LPS O-acetylase OafA/YrhL